MEIITKYGNILSALIQVLMYKFAADQLMDSVFHGFTGIAGALIYLSLIVSPLILVKICETKYAQGFMTKD